MFTFLISSTLMSVALGDDYCGDGQGPRCGNWFDHHVCNTGEACCSDAFNSWCCPPKYKCQGVYHNPGGNVHCMTPEDHSSSCLCTDTKYYVEALTAAGPAKADSAVIIDNFPMTCSAGASNCGFTDSIKWTQQKTVEWSSSVTNSFTMEAGFDVPDLGSAKMSTTISGTWTNGETKSDTQEIDITTECHSGRDGFDYTTRVLLSGNVVKMTQPVNMEYDQCGLKDKVVAKVTATLITGELTCTFVPSTNACDHSDGWDFISNDAEALKAISDVNSGTDCSRFCAAYGPACEFWTYNKDTRWCYLRHLFKIADSQSSCVSGLRCDGLTPEPTRAPTKEPTPEPTRAPTKEPTPVPTRAPTQEPTPEPTRAPTQEPTACTNKSFNQCGGANYSGPTCCPGATKCFEQDQWYSQCLESCPSGWACNHGLQTPFLGQGTPRDSLPAQSPGVYTQKDDVACRKHKIEKNGVKKTYRTRNFAKAKAYCDALGDDCIGVYDSGCDSKGKYNLCKPSNKQLKSKPGNCVHIKEN